MRLTEETYFQAALDRADEARLLYDERRYVFAHYVAGLAVECTFRAYAVVNGEPFEGRHDLRRWFELARFDEVIAPPRLEDVSVAYNVIVTQWNSTQRYYSAGLLHAYFRNAQLDRGIKGDAVKELSRRAVVAALEVVTEGKLRWNIWRAR